MQIYLPIAEMAVQAESIISLGMFVGFLSGVFGVGGGFVTTPLLIFLGIPPAVAVGTQASQLVASSVSGVMAHLRKGNVDIQIGGVMLLGGIGGTFLGVFIFKILQHMGQIDFVIAFLYVALLGSISILMLFESVFSLFRKKTMRQVFNAQRQSAFIASLPYKMRFTRSKLYISACVPVAIGFISGLLVSIMGIGGGFLLVPAMIYILGMPTVLVAGTSLFQIVFTTAFATLMHAVASHTVDFLLAIVLIVGSVVGVQIGAVFAHKISGTHARIVLAALILIVAMQLGLQLFVTPKELFSTEVLS